MTVMWSDGIGFQRVIDLDTAMRFVAVLAEGLGSVQEQLSEYDGEDTPWTKCEHSDDASEYCGYRDLPGFYITALIHGSDVRDARQMIAAYRAARSGWVIFCPECTKEVPMPNDYGRSWCSECCQMVEAHVRATAQINPNISDQRPAVTGSAADLQKGSQR